MSNYCQPVCVSVDCGSTNLKVAIYTSELSIISSASIPVTYSRNDGIHVELDPEAIWCAFMAALSEAIEVADVPVSSVECVSFGSQAQTFCLCDRENKPFSPFYSWLDRGAENEACEVLRIIGKEFHQHCSFSPPIPQLQLCKMLREVKKRNVDHSSMCWASLPGFIGMKLGVGNWMDRNLAAMSGVYSLAERTWWSEALVLLGMKSSQFPGIVDVGESRKVPETCLHTGLEKGCRIVFAGNDQTVGAIGNNCADTGMVVTLGTALVVYRYAGREPGPFSSGGCWGPYPYGGYYELGAFDEGCSALNWAIKELLGKDAPEAFDELASQGRKLIDQPDRDGVRFHPSRMRTEEAWHTTEHSTEAEIAFSVLEGIAFSLKRLIEENLGVREIPSRISVIGGGSNSAIWLQIIADVLDCDVLRGTGDALLGAAMLATGQESTLTPHTSSGIVHPDPRFVPIMSDHYTLWCKDS